MTITMTSDIAKILRQPFPPEVVGKLPRIWCASCRDARGKVCDNHRKDKCHACRNNITTAHLHLDYVGHAETTDRLLQADPGWTWEPVAFNAEGLPVIDGHGGLWIRLTVAGVTRLGYGHAEGKKGPDAIKESIGDAIRNAAMRFGVALDLWGAKFKEDDGDPEPDRPTPPPPEPTAVRDWAVDPTRTETELRDGLARLNREHPDTAKRLVVNEHGDEEALGVLVQRRIHDLAGPAIGRGEPAMVTDQQHRHMHALWRELGYAGDEHRDARLHIINTVVLKRTPDDLLETSTALTAAEADQVIAKLTERRDAVRAQQREPEGANA